MRSSSNQNQVEEELLTRAGPIVRQTGAVANWVLQKVTEVPLSISIIRLSLIMTNQSNNLTRKGVCIYFKSHTVLLFKHPSADVNWLIN